MVQEWRFEEWRFEECPYSAEISADVERVKRLLGPRRLAPVTNMCCPMFLRRKEALTRAATLVVGR